MLCEDNLLLQLMKIGRSVLGERLFAAVMKRTFYGQFVAGEDQDKIKPTIRHMHSFGVKSILDYSVEEDISFELAAEKTLMYARNKMPWRGKIFSSNVWSDTPCLSSPSGQGWRCGPRGPRRHRRRQSREGGRGSNQAVQDLQGDGRVQPEVQGDERQDLLLRGRGALREEHAQLPPVHRGRRRLHSRNGLLRHQDDGPGPTEPAGGSR